MKTSEAMNTSIRGLFRLALAPLLLIPLFAQLPASQQAQVDQAVEKVLVRTGVVGASIAIVKDGKLAYAHAYGFARLEDKVPATPEMRYKIGSNSKQLTATAILLLADEGKLSLADPVARFFPDLTRANEITIRQLLSHTSGYEDYYALDYVAPYMVLPTTADAIMATWAKKALNFDPGTKWQYSNTNYVIAGAIIEKITGRPLIDFLRLRIFEKLGMKSPIDVDGQSWSLADPTGYTRFALGPPRVAIPEGPKWIFAAGELAMTPSDMARWDISLMNGTILKPHLLRELTAEVHLKNGAATGYALGLGIANDRGRRIWRHGGGTSGFVSANTTYPDDRMAITVFTNQDDPAASQIAHDLQNLLLAPPPDPNSANSLELIKTVYGQLANGQLDRTLLTSDANSYFTPLALADYAASLKPLGDPVSIEETSATERGGMSYRYYRVKTSSKELTLSCFITPQGKLDQFLVFPAN
jgi:CubicO group peptidase (beta-lactamase class C family)